MLWNMLGGRKAEPAPHYAELPVFLPANLTGMRTALATDGFALIRGVLTAEEIETARSRIDGLAPIGWDLTGGTDHYKNVFNRDPYWLTFLDRDGVIDLAESCLGADCHIIGETAWRSHPGHRGVGLHLDYLPMEWPGGVVPDGINVPVFIATAHYYLSPQYPALCPTYVIPGSHRAGRRPDRFAVDWNGRLAQPVLCDAGDVLFFRSDLWHSGSNNTTQDQTRYMLQVHYARREMAPHFSPFMEWRFHPDVLRACNRTQKRLLGDHPPGAYD